MYSCTKPVPDPGGNTGGGWKYVPPPPEEAVSVIKKKFAHYMYGNGLVEVWGDLVCFWVVCGVSMDRTTVMLTDQIRKRVCLAL